MTSVISKDGTKIAFDKVGSGPAVILVNGAMSYRGFDPTLGQLAELLGKHFTVYNYDRRGRGESGNTKPFTKKREMEDIQALKVPVLVAYGGASPAWFRNTADALAKALPNASRETLEGQTHQVDAKVLAPVCIEFCKSA